jgi:hypothetical protein
MGQDYVIREYNGVFYDFSLFKGGLWDSAIFLYTSNNCSGTAYLPRDGVELPEPAFVEANKVLWRPTRTPAQFTFESYLSGTCCVTYTTNYSAGVARILDAATPKTWVARFSLTIAK